MTHGFGTGGEDPFDFSVLASNGEDPALESHLCRVRLAATPELIRRQAMRSLGGTILRWARPILAAATLVALCAAGMLIHASGHLGVRDDPLTLAMGVPAPLASWLTTGEKPTTGDLMELTEE